MIFSTNRYEPGGKRVAQAPEETKPAHPNLEVRTRFCQACGPIDLVRASAAMCSLPCRLTFVLHRMQLIATGTVNNGDLDCLDLQMNNDDLDCIYLQRLS